MNYTAVSWALTLLQLNFCLFTKGLDTVMPREPPSSGTSRTSVLLCC